MSDPVATPSAPDAPTPPVPATAALAPGDLYTIVSCLLSRLDSLRERCCDQSQQDHIVDLIARLGGVPARLAAWLDSCGGPADLGPCSGRAHVPDTDAHAQLFCRRCLRDL